jgi:hypothetical protein
LFQCVLLHDRLLFEWIDKTKIKQIPQRKKPFGGLFLVKIKRNRWQIIQQAWFVDFQQFIV